MCHESLAIIRTLDEHAASSPLGRTAHSAEACQLVSPSLASPVFVQPGTQLDLGKGHVLEFIAAPNLHWPDTMFTLDKGTGVMYTCDAFGMHYCSEVVSQGRWRSVHVRRPIDLLILIMPSMHCFSKSSSQGHQCSLRCILHTQLPSIPIAKPVHVGLFLSYPLLPHPSFPLVPTPSRCTTRTSTSWSPTSASTTTASCAPTPAPCSAPCARWRRPAGSSTRLPRGTARCCGTT